MTIGQRVEVLVAQNRQHPTLKAGRVQKVQRSPIDGLEYVDVRLDSGGVCYSCAPWTVRVVAEEQS